MRVAPWVLAALLAVPPALAQQAADPGPGGAETMAQPRFVRVPTEGTGGQEGGVGVEQPVEPEWLHSRDRRFHRAPRKPRETDYAPSGSVVPIEAPDTELRQGARLRELDKMTGKTATFELAVGETRQVGRLRIELDACRSPDANDTHGTMAFLKIWDTKYENADVAFSGWMFAESPALSALDHPRYDLWVISCTTSAVAESTSRQ